MFPRKIVVANDGVQCIIIGVRFLQIYGGVLDFAEQELILTYPGNAKVKNKIRPGNYKH